jgi:enoyl-CoA hydratase/carnithine racemase
VIDIDERDDRVVVTLRRPEKRNAIDADMVAALHDVCGHLAASPKLLLLTGGADGESAHPHVDLLGQALLFESPDKHERMTAFLRSRDRNAT